VDEDSLREILDMLFDYFVEDLLAKLKLQSIKIGKFTEKYNILRSK